MESKYAPYQSKAPYYTLNSYSETTEHVWIACHGFGQMVKYFSRRFDVLDASKHYLLFPQGLDRFYMDNYTKVGASWTTREERDLHLENQQAYLDQMWAIESPQFDWSRTQLHLFGFSQGVSVITRWAVKAQLPFDRMIMWAGGFPPELTADKWAFKKPQTEFVVVLGNQDPFINAAQLDKQGTLLQSAFGEYQSIRFEGGHELNRDVIAGLDLAKA
ncbi:MAG: hypothetical protein AAFR61_01705 [Bacteroidota bacterium]